MADRLLALIHTFDSNFSLTYRRNYIGLQQHGRTKNCAVFRPRKRGMLISPRIAQVQEVDSLIEDAGLDIIRYYTHSGRYAIMITPKDIDENAEVLTKLLKLSYDQYPH